MMWQNSFHIPPSFQAAAGFALCSQPGDTGQTGRLERGRRAGTKGRLLRVASLTPADQVQEHNHTG